MTRRSLLVALACATFGALFPVFTFAQTAQLIVIELNSRTADEVIPLLKPMLARGGTISGLKDKLIIRTTPENLDELRSMLDVIDARPRRLLISIGQERGSLDETREISVAGSIGNDNVRIVLPDTSDSAIRKDVAQLPNEQNNVRIRANEAQSVASLRISQRVQVLEGNSAFIGTGESVPLHGRSTASSVDTRETIGFQETISGFYAIPRTQGNRVNIQLASAADMAIDRRTGVAQIQRVSTVVSGRIGEWIEVGGVSEISGQRQSATGARQSSGSHGNKRIYIKVDEIK